MTKLAHLKRRSVLALSGEDRVAFLQGLVSNDVARAAPACAVWAALLTPQGRWLADFFVFADASRLLLDVEREAAGEISRRLLRYKLRAKIAIEELSLSVYAAWKGKPETLALAAPDPRLPEAGWRILAPGPLPGTADETEWDEHRLALGLPDSGDLEADKTLLLEAGFDELNGISWAKGCYLGQEVTARSKYRGLIKRRLVPVAVEGELPPPGSPITQAGDEVGSLRSGHGALALAMLRLTALEGPLACAGAVLTPRIPPWMRLPAPAR